MRVLFGIMSDIVKKQHNTCIFLKFLEGAILLSTFYFLLSGTFASAATLYLSPPSGNYLTNQDIPVVVYVTSSEQAINAVSGSISFRTNRLEAISISKTGSSIGLWIQEPNFSNETGSINFEGIILNPGFQGIGGKVLTITFRPKAAGEARLSIANASILANDGQGTNVLTTVEGSVFQLNSYIQSSPRPTTQPEQPQQSVIRSSTHPNPEKWYSNQNPVFLWDVPEAATAVRVGYGKSASVEPTKLYDPAIGEYGLENINEGIWYLVLQMRTANGWGPVYRFKFRIDVTPPRPFKIKFVDGPETRNPRPVALFDTTDALSGIDFYKVKVGDSDFKNVSAELAKSNPHPLGPYPPGTHTVLVQAFDLAGNYTTDSLDLTILPIDTPVIIEYPRSLDATDFFVVRGNTYPDALVTIFLQRGLEGPHSFVISSNDSGAFTFIADDHLKEGVYKMWAKVTDKRGAQSLPTEKYSVIVEQNKFVQLGTSAASVIVMLIIFGILLTILVVVSLYIRKRITVFRKGMQKEILEAEQGVHRAFDFLRGTVRDQIGLLSVTKTKRELTREEGKVIEQLEDNLDQAERFLKKEIEDIEKSSKVR